MRYYLQCRVWQSFVILWAYLAEIKPDTPVESKIQRQEGWVELWLADDLLWSEELLEVLDLWF